MYYKNNLSRSKEVKKNKKNITYKTRTADSYCLALIVLSIPNKSVGRIDPSHPIAYPIVLFAENLKSLSSNIICSSRNCKHRIKESLYNNRKFIIK